MSSVAIGLDLGGTQIKGVVATWTGDILRREVRDQPPSTASTWPVVKRAPSPMK